MISRVGAMGLRLRHCGLVHCDQQRFDEATLVATDVIGPLPWLVHQLVCSVLADD
jgi:hypothetical protein